jgi:hypothetical protein
VSDETSDLAIRRLSERTRSFIVNMFGGTLDDFCEPLETTEARIKARLDGFTGDWPPGTPDPR